MNTVISILAYLFSFLPNKKQGEQDFIANGKQPELSVDGKGVVWLVYGRNDSIFYNRKNTREDHFSTPVYVAHIPEMHLGMTRGPQLASSANFSMITAMDKKGDIHWFLIENKNGKVIKNGLLNDLKGSAPEGLMGLAGDEHDHFYAVWLDLRLNRQNNIFFSSFSTTNSKWSSNHLVYQSPEGHTCECCKPNIAVKGSHVAVMFRNWLSGSRDLYLAESFNSGKTFGQARKMGSGTWKLKGCPMDGGGIGISHNDQIVTVWQREGNVYMCQPGEKEVLLGKGRACSLTEADHYQVCSFQEGDQLKLKELTAGKENIIGKGSYLKTVILPGNQFLCVWEDDGKIKTRIIEI